LRLRAAYSMSEYALGGEFDVLDSTGSSRSLNLTAAYPLIRSVDRNLIASVEYSRTRLTDDAAGMILSDRELGAGTALVLDERALPGGGRMVAQVSLRTGNVRFLSD